MCTLALLSGEMLLASPPKAVQHTLFWNNTTGRFVPGGIVRWQPLQLHGRPHKYRRSAVWQWQAWQHM